MKIQKPREPSKPRKPIEPIPPPETVNQEIILRDFSYEEIDISLKELISLAEKENVKPEHLHIRFYVEDECYDRYSSAHQEGKIYHYKEVKNRQYDYFYKRYEKSLKTYEKKLIKYEKDMEDYEKKMIEFNKQMKEYETFRKKEELKKLEKQYNKLKKEVGSQT